MNIVTQLSSQIGDRTEAANRRVAEQCLADPTLLADIADGLLSRDDKLQGDCAEVLTKTAAAKPELVVPYVMNLVRLLSHKTTRVRWEAMHALALIAEFVPDIVESRLAQLANMIQTDKSTIVRDHAVDAVGNYAKTGRQAAEKAFPILNGALRAWGGKHAARALNGLGIVAEVLPDYRNEVYGIAGQYLGHKRGVVAKAAKSLLKRLEPE